MKKYIHFIAIGLIALGVVIAAFYGADAITENDAAKRIAEQYGIFGMVVIGFVSGLNLVVPLHPTIFTPVFLNVGFSLPVIIAAMIVGTTSADLVSFALGRLGKERIEEKHRKFHAKLVAIREKHRRLFVPFIFLYSAFAPLPNELILIPLGLMGYRLIVILIPLVFGTIINHSILAFGFLNAFEFLFS